MNERLSVIPYFGGKARLSRDIADLINYDDTDRFIDIMGGSGRVLINKAAHVEEIYNDISKGLFVLFKVLSGVRYKEFIDYVLDTSRYSEEAFLSARDIFLRVEKGEKIEEYLVARSMFEVFAQSRDSMGEVWHTSKYPSQMGYLNRAMRLYEAGSRLQGVGVYNIDVKKLWMDSNSEESNIVRGWLDNPRNMIYIDPPYIDIESEEELLKGVDIENTEILWSEIERENGRLPRDLGVAYLESFNYREHEDFIQIVAESNARILFSNYEAVLFDKYLKSKDGWKKTTIETVALAGKKAGGIDKRRREILYWNY